MFIRLNTAIQDLALWFYFDHENYYFSKTFSNLMEKMGTRDIMHLLLAYTGNKNKLRK